MANQFRNYILTVNNPVQTDEEFNEYLKTLQHIRYFTFQREIGEETGTQHFQLYIEFEVGKRFATIKEYFPTAHIESRKGSKKQARDYCQKDDTRMDGHNIFEFGDFAENGERSDLNDIMEMIKGGASLKEVEAAYPSQYFRYYKNIEFLFNQYMQDKFCEIDRNIKVTYIWGPPRAGKSRSIDKLHSRKNYYRVPKYKNPFDKYNYEPVLVLDEYAGQIDITYLNNLLDSLPCQLECRYNDKWAAWDTVYIISNLPFEKQYPYELPEKREALKSRITEFIHFTGEKPTDKPKKLTVAELKPLSDEEAGELPF